MPVKTLLSKNKQGHLALRFLYSKIAPARVYIKGDALQAARASNIISSHYIRIMHSNILLLAIAFFVALTQALPLERRVGNINILVKSASQFCSYLPPNPGQPIAEAEGSAVPFCTQVQASGTRQFPSGFIVSAHYKSTSTYTQVTGRIDRSKYKLSASDGGGQYDNKNEIGGKCNGWGHWVNLVEPDSNIFCIRCCENSSDCNLGRSEYGCQSVVPGDYS
ncbi:hypothetical protein BJV82DRAFT_634808 [Fennellomyces sp. T-0311]|nr:hypothetical protein BJV82DRAFT_634808 [Fennellomyces sp. T-0311]